MKKKILLVDDDKILRTILEAFFREKGFAVSSASDGADALIHYNKEIPDMVLLDLDMPNMNGFQVVEAIRQEDCITPIILMTGSWIDETHKIRGYELGAIQFLEKPVTPMVLLAQINSLLNPPLKECKVCSYQHNFKLSNQTLVVDDKKIILREREAQILATLFEHPNYMVSRQKIQTLIWGNDDVRNNKTLDNLIYQVKRKLEDYPELVIRSCYSKGYVLEIRQS